MSESLALSLLEAHRVAERGRATARDSRLRIRPDHVVSEGESAALVLRLFETLGRERTSCELALVAAESDALGIDRAEAWERTEAAARRRGVLCSRPGNGAVQQVYLARFAAPGRVVLGTSARLAACGALGCLALPASAVEAAAALAGAAVEISRPDLLHVRLFGKPAGWVAGDDVALELERRLAFTPARAGIVEYRMFEPDALPVEDRIAIAARAPWLGAQSSLFDSDQATRAYLASNGREADWRALAATLSEPTEPLLDLDFSTLEPLVAVPGADGVLRLRELGDARVSLVWIGPEASRLDLERFARALEGTRLPDAVQGFVSFGNRRDHETAIRSGVLAALRAVGLRVATRPNALPRRARGDGSGPGLRRTGRSRSGMARSGRGGVRGGSAHRGGDRSAPARDRRVRRRPRGLRGRRSPDRAAVGGRSRKQRERGPGPSCRDHRTAARRGALGTRRSRRRGSHPAVGRAGTARRAPSGASRAARLRRTGSRVREPRAGRGAAGSSPAAGSARDPCGSRRSWWSRASACAACSRAPSIPPSASCCASTACAGAALRGGRGRLRGAAGRRARDPGPSRRPGAGQAPGREEPHAGAQYTLHHDLDAEGARAKSRAGGLLAAVELDEAAPA